MSGGCALFIVRQEQFPSVYFGGMGPTGADQGEMEGCKAVRGRSGSGDSSRWLECVKSRVCGM